MSEPLRVVLEYEDFKALVLGKVAETAAVTGQVVHLMLADIGLDTMIRVIEQARREPDPPEQVP